MDTEKIIACGSVSVRFVVSDLVRRISCLTDYGRTTTLAIPLSIALLKLTDEQRRNK
jgi:hypothetical protein